MTTIENTLQNLEESFETFKNNHLKRLDCLEAKHRRPPLETMETDSPWEESQHKQAFLSYLTKGDEKDLYGFEKKALSSVNDKDGGFLIPPMITLKVEQELKAYSLMRSVASVMTISTEAIDVLVDKKGAAVGWVGEVDERAETETPELLKIKIPVHEIYGRPRATKKFLEDASVNVEEWLIRLIGQKIAQTENQAFFKGDGKNKPMGFLSYETVEKNHWEWGKLEEIKGGDKGRFLEEAGLDALIDCMNALKSHYYPGAVWLLSRSAYGMVRKLKDRTGNYLWQPGSSKEQNATLLGFPMFVSDEMPDMAGKGGKGIAFGNFKQGYQIVDRENLHILRDPYSAKPYVEFYTTARVGGAVVDFEAIKILTFDAE